MEHVDQFDATRRTLPGFDMYRTGMETCLPFGAGTQVLHVCRQLVSRDVGLSPATSATLVACCHQVKLGTLARLPAICGRKAGMTSSPHGPYIPGFTRATMAGTKGCNTARWSQSQKAGLSSDWSLQLDSMKSESLVIADQHAAVNTFPGLVHTARQATKADSTRSR